MVPQELIPTPLVRYSERADIQLVESPPESNRNGFHVAVSFAKFLLGILWLRVIGRLTGEVAGRRLRTLLERHGFLWVKVGQLLSLRNDVFSVEFCRELSQLQHQATGFPFAQVREMIEFELGGALSDHFAEFDERPFAAASISQVHRALLKRDGALVAVKVQRPEVLWIFNRDFNLIRRMIGTLQHLEIASYMRWDDMLWELNQIMLEETDYRYEVSHLQRMRKSLKSHRIHVPEVYEELSYQRVLVMEFIQGALMSDFIALQHSEPQKLRAWLEDNNIEPSEVGTQLFLSFFRQLMDDNLFHGDLHPGNIVLLRDSRIAFIDLGTIGSLDADFMDLYKRAVQALTTYQYVQGVELILLLCPDLPPVNLGEMMERLIECYRSWAKRSTLRELPYHERSMMSVTHEVSQVMMSFGVVGSMTFLKLSRTWATLDASLNYLIPEVNYAKLISRYFKETVRRAKKRPLRPKLVETVIEVKETVTEYKDLLEPMMRQRALWLRGGTSTLSFTLGTIGHSAKVVVGGLAALYLYAILDTTLAAWLHHLPIGGWLQRMAIRLPAPQVPEGKFLVLAVLLFVYYQLSKTVKRLFTEEVRLPSPFMAG